jgi:hypothetical protein
MHQFAFSVHRPCFNLLVAMVNKTFRNTQSTFQALPSFMHLMAMGTSPSYLYVRLIGLPAVSGLDVSPSMHLIETFGHTYRWLRRNFSLGTTDCLMLGYLPSRTSPANVEPLPLPLQTNWFASMMDPFSRALTTSPALCVTTFCVLPVKSPKPHAGHRPSILPATKRHARWSSKKTM